MKEQNGSTEAESKPEREKDWLDLILDRFDDLEKRIAELEKSRA